MYYWPITAAVVGVGSNFLFLVITISLIWVRETMKFSTDDQQNLKQHQSMRKESRKLSKRRILQKSVGFSQDIPEKEVEFSRSIKREKTEIETLLSHPDVKPSKKVSRSLIIDDEEDDFFDPESPAIPIQGTVESSTMEQRIKQILGKKE